MSTNEQRRQWAQHIADEAQALQLQQDSAGGTHSPSEGPLPFTADEFDAGIAREVARERQRCAEVAERLGSESVLREAFAGFGEAELRAAAAAARAIAAEIRGERQT